MLALIGGSSASAGEVVTRSFTANEDSFVVPAGVSSIEVVAVGGAGGSNARGVIGGQGARASGALSVTPGETLYVHVGGKGVGATLAGHAGTGGGASDVRTLPVSEGLLPDPRLLVAGGGGGAGGQPATGLFGPGSQGGNAGEMGNSTNSAFGGEPGTQTAGGEGGTAICSGGTADPNGENGALESGGAGGHCTRGEIYGGGGGLGYYGGGGGGAGGPVSTTKEGAAGGGGGSSLVPAGGALSLAGSTAAQVTISYTQPPNPPAVVTAAATNVIRNAATLNGTVNPEDGEVTSCIFEYGQTEAYGQTVGCTPAPGAGIAPVSVSATVTGLIAATAYHYRVLATNAHGTSYGSDRTFTTLLHDPPTISSLSPTAGITSGGTSVTITGTELYEVTSVRFGSANAASFVVNSPESITAVSPPGTGTVDVSVGTPSGTTATSASDRFTYVPPPAITAVSPTAGPEGGATKVSISGSGFNGVTAVTFGGVNATTFAVNSDSAIVATSPPGVGTVDIAVTKPVGGTSPSTAADRFAYEVAAPPEYGRCLKVATGAGRFSSGTCTTLGGEKKYEWYPAFGIKPLGKTHFTTKLKEKTEAILQTVGGRVVSCKGESGTGEYTGNKTIGNVTLTFTGCHLGALGSCQSSGAGEGEVASSSLAGELGTIKTSSEGAAKNLVGTDLEPATGEVFAAFACAGTPVRVTGSVIGEAKRNSMTALGTLKFLQSKGVQKPTRFVGGEEDDLLSAFGEGAPEHSGLNLTAVQGDEEKVEVNSIY
ncbi:MAG TPA: IPT/TIG domain-containing protein [Solirubrobacteraceae bacterium]|jgi:hypothetical protein|nr:IPT/TIG domain-containing protein [Solirubrobacteraceae bacterium]